MENLCLILKKLIRANICRKEGRMNEAMHREILDHNLQGLLRICHCLVVGDPNMTVILIILIFNFRYVFMLRGCISLCQFLAIG